MKLKLKWFLAAILCAVPALSRADDDSAAYQQAVASVVGIIKTSDDAVCTGTGVVTRASELVLDGRTYRGCLILTAEHVVLKGRIEVIFPRRDDGGDIIGDPEAYVGKPATIIGTDHARDLALLRVVDSEGVRAIRMASSARPGQQVFTIGAGSGILWHYASGNVRQIFHGAYKTKISDVNTRLIELTVPLNPGDSGGPIIDREGMLVGVNLSTATTSNQVHYGVCVSEIRRFESEAILAEWRAMLKKQK